MWDFGIYIKGKGSIIGFFLKEIVNYSRVIVLLGCRVGGTRVGRLERYYVECDCIFAFLFLSWLVGNTVNGYIVLFEY